MTKMFVRSIFVRSIFVRSIVTLIAYVAFLFLSVGCVTEQSSRFNTYNQEKAISSSLAAAMEYLKINNLERAQAHLNRAIAADSNNAEVLNGWAVFYQVTGDYKLEEKYYKKALKQSNGASKIRNNYASMLYRQGRYEEAAKQLTAASEDTEYRGRAGVFENLGKAQIKLGQPEQAMLSFKRAIRLDQNRFDALLELSNYYFTKAQLEESKRYFDQYQLLKNEPSARGLLMGATLAKAQKDQDALSSFQLLLSKLFPDSYEHKYVASLSI